MTAILAIVAQLLPILAQLPGDVAALIAWIQSVRTTAQQSQEWTPELEAAFLSSMAGEALQPEQLTDAAFTRSVLALTASQKALALSILAPPALSQDKLFIRTAAQTDADSNKALADAPAPFTKAR